MSPDASGTRLAKAVAHPTRARIFWLLVERDAALTAAELAEALGVPIGAARYHLRMLMKLDCVGASESDGDSGTPARYRALRRPILTTEDCETLPPTVHIELDRAVIENLHEDFRLSELTGAVGARSDRVSARVPLVLDDQAWKELAADLEELLARAIAKQDEAAARLATGGSGGARIETVVGLLQFPAPPARPLSSG